MLLWGAFALRELWLPATADVAAKSVAYQLPRNAAFIRLLQHYGTPFIEDLTFGRHRRRSALLYPVLFALGALTVFRRNLRLAYPRLSVPLPPPTRSPIRCSFAGI